MTLAEIQQLPRIEKIKLMEAIWADLSAEEGSFESPPWHLAELKKTGEHLAAGKEEILDWALAKKELRKPIE